MTPSDAVALRVQLYESNRWVFRQLRAGNLVMNPDEPNRDRAEWSMAMTSYETTMLGRCELFVWKEALWQQVLRAAHAMPQPVTYRTPLSGPSGLYLFECPIRFPGFDYAISGLAWQLLDGTNGDTAVWAYAKGLVSPVGKVRKGSPLDVLVMFLVQDGTQCRLPNQTYPLPSAIYNSAVTDDDWTGGIMLPLLASWIWLKQRIIVLRGEPVLKASRKLAERAKVLSSVHTVVLRRAEQMPRGPGNEAGIVEWSCQWLVRGHWRRQYYPSTGDHLPIFIEPHVKGPEDKPLRIAPDTVFAVTR